MGSIFSCVLDDEGLDKHELERLNTLKKGVFALRVLTLFSPPYDGTASCHRRLNPSVLWQCGWITVVVVAAVHNRLVNQCRRVFPVVFMCRVSKRQGVRVVPGRSALPYQTTTTEQGGGFV